MKLMIKETWLSIPRPVLSLALAAGLLTAANANQVTVQTLGVSPYRTVRIDVPGYPTDNAYAHAGVLKLLVDGVATDGFCIDPFHFSSSQALLYTEFELQDAPKPPGPMGVEKATTISKLWAMAYSPTMTADQAAGLQIAIWEVVGGTGFGILSGNDYGAAALIAAAATYQGPGADLIGLSRPINGQDYVIQRVGDTGMTVGLFGLALLGLVGLNWVRSGGWQKVRA